MSARLLPQEAREVARDGRIRRVGQAHFLQTGAPRICGMSVLATRGKKAFEHLFDLFAAQRCFDRAADQARSFAENRDRHFVGLRLRIEQLFLREAAVVPQRLQLEAVDLRAFRGQFGRYRVGEREIDVVAAEQDVFADRDALQLQLAGVFA